MNRAHRLRAILATALCLLTGPAQAHGPLHGEIEAIGGELSRNPGNATLLLHRAELYRLDGNPTAARDDLAEAARTSPAPDGLEWTRSRVYLDLGKTTDALRDLNRWLDRHPRHGPGLTLRAEILERTGDLPSAVHDYTRAIAVTVPPSPDLYLARARVQRRMGTDPARDALRGLDEGMAHLGMLVTLQLEAISLEEFLGRTDEALARVDAMNRKASRHERWLVRRAELQARAGRPEEATRSWREALDACQALPERIRSLPATRELEDRIRTNLAELPLRASTHTAVAGSPVNPGIRVLPEGTVLTP
ncbi:MAG: tetratricopeptide repeat protein [Verrucomicrobiales bacterium]|nr:tetratricopeptide repeat protein [Verrucomicrobiales bacterium]